MHSLEGKRRHRLVLVWTSVWWLLAVCGILVGYLLYFMVPDITSPDGWFVRDGLGSNVVHTQRRQSSSSRNKDLEQKLRALIEEAKGLAQRKGIFTETAAYERRRVEEVALRDRRWQMLLQESDVSMYRDMDPSVCMNDEDCRPGGECMKGGHCSCTVGFSGPKCGHPLVFTMFGGGITSVGYVGRDSMATRYWLRGRKATQKMPSIPYTHHQLNNYDHAPFNGIHDRCLLSMMDSMKDASFTNSLGRSNHHAATYSLAVTILVPLWTSRAEAHNDDNNNSNDHHIWGCDGPTSCDDGSEASFVIHVAGTKTYQIDEGMGAADVVSLHETFVNWTRDYVPTHIDTSEEQLIPVLIFMINACKSMTFRFRLNSDTTSADSFMENSMVNACQQLLGAASVVCALVEMLARFHFINIEEY